MMRDRDGAIIKFNSLSMTYPSRRNFKSSKVFEDIKAALENRGESLVKKIKGVFAFKVAVPDGRIGLWIVDVKNGSGNVEFEGTGNLTKLFSILPEHLRPSIRSIDVESPFSPQPNRMSR